MNKYFNSARTIYFSLAFILFLVACNDKDNAGENADSTGTTNINAERASLTGGLNGGTLDTLYIRREAFDTIGMGSRLSFAFTFTREDTLLTLHGWLFKGGGGKPFDSLPNLKLSNGKPGGLQYRPETYFSTVELPPNEYNKLKTALTADTKYVLFAPYAYGNNIGYKIFLTNDEIVTATGFGIYAITPTGADANPSPPRLE